MSQPLLSQAILAPLLQSWRRRKFNTLHFAALLKMHEPARYASIEREYGLGGKGAGRHYSSITFIAKSLAMYVRNWAHGSDAPELCFAGYERAPRSHGSPVIACWSCTTNDAGDRLTSDIQEIFTDDTLTPSQKKRLVNARLGQGAYRSRLIKLWKSCPMTNCADGRVLVASHIKPWSESSRGEQLDPFNGILLSPNADRLFDRGLIGFADDGRVLRSQLLRPAVLQQLGLPLEVRIPFEPRHFPYLAYHRRKWLSK